MKKLIVKDKKLRKIIKKLDKKQLILKLIKVNHNLPNIIRLNVLNKSTGISHKVSKTRVSNRCVNTINKKKFMKFNNFSRIFFKKLVKNRIISNLYKSSW